MTIVQRVNEKGLRHLANWIKATANEDHRHTDPQNLDAWANEAEESMGNGNPPMVEMQAPATLSGMPETFTIPADGIYQQDDLSPAARSSLARITRACAMGETAQGHDLFDIPELHKVADIPVERLHATYDYSMAVDYLAKLIPADAAALADETGVETAWTRAENYRLLLDGARTVVEKTRALTAANNDSISCEFEDGSTNDDELGMTLECITAFEFSDGSRLFRNGESAWADGAWSAACGGGPTNRPRHR